MEIEYSGKIIKLLHPKDNGFVQYEDEQGIEHSVYFRSRIDFYKSGRNNLWQIGDNVSFIITNANDDKKIARISAFKGNANADDFYNSLDCNNPHTLSGFLEVYQDDLFLRDSHYNLLFNVLKTTPSDIKIDAEKEYEAILNVKESKRNVVLVEWIKLHERLKLYRMHNQVLKCCISEIYNNYIKIIIPRTDFYGKVLGFDRNKNYNIGEDIEVRCFTNKNLTIDFSVVGYRKEEKNHSLIPQSDTKYQAIIIERRHLGYNIEVLGEDGLGAIIFCRNEYERYNINDIIDVYYAGRKDSARRYIYLTTKQYLNRKQTIS